MAGALEESLLIDLRCGESDAATIASLARDCVPRIVESAEDSDEDLVVRLRDPRVFGEFAVPLLDDSHLSAALRTMLAERVFDLLPLPRGEGDVIVVESRAPSRLLAAAAFLARVDRLSVLHVLHLVYALFLDRGLAMRVDRPIRAFVLGRILDHAAVNEGLRAFYAAMHLASVPEQEAHSEFRRTLNEPSIPITLKSALVQLAEEPDRGTARLLSIARDEGLLPSEPIGSDEPLAVVNIPRMPERLRAVARRWRGRNE